MPRTIGKNVRNRIVPTEYTHSSPRITGIVGAGAKSPIRAAAPYKVANSTIRRAHRTAKPSPSLPASKKPVSVDLIIPAVELGRGPSDFSVEEIFDSVVCSDLGSGPTARSSRARMCRRFRPHM